MILNSESDNQEFSSWQIVKTAFFNTNQYFIRLVSDISFSLLLFICAFVPLWIWYINTFGIGHWMVMIFQIMMFSSMYILVLFMVSFYLFNIIHPASQSLKFWKFAQEVSWPWLVEGIKASMIIVATSFLFIIPGVIKQIHYIFFSFVVFFNQDYKKGKINALKHSKKLSKGLGWWIFGLFMVLPYFINYISMAVVQKVVLVEQTQSVWIMFPILILCVYIVVLTMTYLYSILYFMYVIKDQNQMVNYDSIK